MTDMCANVLVHGCCVVNVIRIHTYEYHDWSQILVSCEMPIFSGNIHYKINTCSQLELVFQCQPASPIHVPPIQHVLKHYHAHKCIL